MNVKANTMYKFVYSLIYTEPALCIINTKIDKNININEVIAKIIFLRLRKLKL